jgi:hypothetical protein
MKFIIRWVPLFAVLAVLSIGMALPVAGQTPDNRQLYIPIVTQEHNYGRSISIYGRVDSVIGDRVILTLDFFDGVTMMPIVANLVHWPYPPEYTFLNLPPLEAGQFYQVSYYNGEFGNFNVPEHLKAWHSFPITESANGSLVEHNFSIYNFEFLFPSDGRQVQSPFSFQWKKSRDPYYVLNLYDTNETLLYSTTGGQIESYLFDPLSVGLSLNTPYLWDVTIANPDGSIGIANNPKREVTFVAEAPIAVPTGLSGYCDVPHSDWTACHFSWQPIEGTGTTQYFVESGIDDHSPGGVWRWVDIPEAGGYVVCFGVETTTSWRVKARNDIAEGRYSDWQTVRVPPCPPPCNPCMREIFKEQAEWQSVNEQLFPTMGKQ